MSAFTPAGSGGQPATPITVDGVTVTTPTVANVAIVAAATEYSYALPVGTKRVLLKLRSTLPPGHVQWAWSPAAVDYGTFGPNGFYSEGDLDSPTLTIYFQCSVAGQVAEILTWV